jgi:hypothetical protein
MSVADLRREMEQWIAWDEAARAANGEDHLIALELHTAVSNDETGRRLQRLLELAMRVPGNLQYGRLRVETIFEDGGLEIQTLPSYSYEIQARIWELWEEITDAEGLDLNLTPSGRSDAWLHVNFNGRLQGELTQAFLYRAVAAQAEFSKPAQLSLRPEVPPSGHYYPLRVRDPRESKLSQDPRTELTLMIHAATAEVPNSWVPFLGQQVLRKYRRDLLREIDGVVAAYRRRDQQPERWLREITDLPQANLRESAILRKNPSFYAEEIRGAQRFYDQRTEAVDGREELARLKADFEAKGFSLEWEESFETDPALWKPLGLSLLNNHDLVAGHLLAKRQWSWGAELQVEGQRARLVAPPAGPTPHETYNDFVDRYLRPRVEGRSGFVSILFQREGVYGVSPTGWPHLIDGLFMPEGLGEFFSDRGGNFALALMLPQQDHDRWWNNVKLLLDPRNLRRISADGNWGSPDQPVHPRFGERALDLSGYVAKTIREPGADRKIPASYIVAAAGPSTSLRTGLEEEGVGYVAVEGLVAAVPAWASRSTYGVTVGPAQTEAALRLGTLSPGRFIVVSAGAEEDQAIAELGVPLGQIVRDKTAAIELAGGFLQMAEGFREVRVLDTTARTPAELRSWLGLSAAWQGSLTAGAEERIMQLEELSSVGV